MGIVTVLLIAVMVLACFIGILYGVHRLDKKSDGHSSRILKASSQTILALCLPLFVVLGFVYVPQLAHSAERGADSAEALAFEADRLNDEIERFETRADELMETIEEIQGSLDAFQGDFHDNVTKLNENVKELKDTLEQLEFLRALLGGEG